MQGLRCYSLLPDAGAGSWVATAYLMLVQGLGCDSLPDAGAGSWVATAYLTLVQGLGCYSLPDAGAGSRVLQPT